MPKIQELLQRLRNFKWATAIDLSMGYYHIPLDLHSQKLCTTVLPWGKFRYKRLPMGVHNSPDIFQQIINDLLGDLGYVSTYLDDILILSDGTFEDHMTKLMVVLRRLDQANFRANVRKCFFAQTELDYLGYHITRKGIQPQTKKVEAILRLKAPKTKRQLRHFLGMVNYYRDMWRRRSHLLAPLTALLSKGKNLKWTEEHQKAFDEVKRVISRETLLSFPDYDRPFHIFADASDTQLGAVIMQDDKPLAFYSRKLNSAQKSYTTGEQELLSIVEVLKEFRTLLYGQEVIIHTDHKNILYGNLANDRIIRWRLLIEEYSPVIQHIKGEDNVVADALSRMEALPDDLPELMPGDEASPEMIKTGKLYAHAMATIEINEQDDLPDEDDYEEWACFLSKEEDAELEHFPMSPRLLAKEQQSRKKEMEEYSKKSKAHFKEKVIEGENLLTLNKRIVVPRSLQQRIIAWYHLYLRHTGQTRLEATIGQLYWWPSMNKDIMQHVKTCRECQKCKKVRKKYGHLPAKEAEPAIPWNRVNVDLIGPLTVKATNGTFELLALTMIDPATGWFKIAEVRNKTPEEVSEVFDHVWLSRYPRPQELGCDNGGENKGVFRTMVQNYGVKQIPTTTHNPQANGIIERIHAVLNDALRTFELEECELDQDKPFAEFLTATAFAIRSTYHTVLEATPTQLVFGRDVILPVKFKFDWDMIRRKRQLAIDKNNERENNKRVKYTYKVGDKVLYNKHGILRKSSTPRRGPYEITHVYENGTVRIRRGVLSERINIRHLSPFFESSTDLEANVLIT